MKPCVFSLIVLKIRDLVEALHLIPGTTEKQTTQGFSPVSLQCLTHSCVTSSVHYRIIAWKTCPSPHSLYLLSLKLVANTQKTNQKGGDCLCQLFFLFLFGLCTESKRESIHALSCTQGLGVVKPFLFVCCLPSCQL